LFFQFRNIVFNIRTKTWQQTQISQYARGYGSAAVSPYSSGIPRIIYSMGKSRNWMYSVVETSGQMASGYNQFGGGQSAISKFELKYFSYNIEECIFLFFAVVMYDMPSLSPAYPHARYAHSTTLLTDNHLLLYGGCLR
jgi:hypothetical protein